MKRATIFALILASSMACYYDFEDMIEMEEFEQCDEQGPLLGWFIYPRRQLTIIEEPNSGAGLTCRWGPTRECIKTKDYVPFKANQILSINYYAHRTDPTEIINFEVGIECENSYKEKITLVDDTDSLSDSQIPQWLSKKFVSNLGENTKCKIHLSCYQSLIRVYIDNIDLPDTDTADACEIGRLSPTTDPTEGTTELESSSPATDPTDSNESSPSTTDRTDSDESSQSATDPTDSGESSQSATDPNDSAENSQSTTDPSISGESSPSNTDPTDSGESSQSATDPTDSGESSQSATDTTDSGESSLPTTDPSNSGESSPSTTDRTDSGESSESTTDPSNSGESSQSTTESTERTTDLGESTCTPPNSEPPEEGDCVCQCQRISKGRSGRAPYQERLISTRKITFSKNIA